MTNKEKLNVQSDVESYCDKALSNEKLDVMAQFLMLCPVSSWRDDYSFLRLESMFNAYLDEDEEMHPDNFERSGWLLRIKDEYFHTPTVVSRLVKEFPNSKPEMKKILVNLLEEFKAQKVTDEIKWLMEHEKHVEEPLIEDTDEILPF